MRVRQRRRTHTTPTQPADPARLRAVLDLLDLAFSVALRHAKFFAAGWGDLALVEGERVADAPPDPLEVELGPPERREGVVMRSGSFDAPDRRLPSGRRARVRLLEPVTGAPEAAVLLLASSGDQGFAAREAFAAPLVRRGLAVLLLENPFYGTRRPPGQAGAAMRTVSDLVLMAAAATREGRALAAWLRARGHGRVGVAGYSMGGQVAAMVGCTLPFPVAIAALAPSATPASVFAEGHLRHAVDLDALGGGPAARAMLHRRLARFDVARFPRPAPGSTAIVVGGRKDGIVTPPNPEAVARHLGAELRWLDAGHVTAVLFHQEALRRAVWDAVSGLPRAEARAAG